MAEALRALAGSESRSETSRLREVFDEVETALSAGVSRTAILETLHEQGFTMTAKSFESALYRLRKQREAGKLPKAKAERVHASLSSAAAENRAAAPSGWKIKVAVSLCLVVALSGVAGAIVGAAYVKQQHGEEEARQIAAGKDFLNVLPMLDQPTRDRLASLIDKSRR